MPRSTINSYVRLGVLSLTASLALSACVDGGVPEVGSSHEALTATTADPTPAPSHDPARLATTAPHQRATAPHYAAWRHEHRLPWGTCVTVTPPPPAWAYRPDGSLKRPTDIHRPKADAEQILFLNLDGPAMVRGGDDPEQNQSFIVSGPVTIPAFDDAPFRKNGIDTREKVIYALVQWVSYYYAHMNVRVTTQRPPAGWAYTMMVVGGSPQAIGESSGVLGIATFDCYKDPSNVGFVFSEDHGSNLEMLVLTIVHEAGHTFGLAHIDNQEAIMYPVNPMGDAYWGSGQTTDSYACDDTTSQDSFDMLQFMLGAREDALPPWVEIVTPGDGAIVPSTLEARVHGTDNVVLYRTELFLDGVTVGSEILPTFDFQVSNLTDGPHELYAIGEDGHGNVGTSEPITVTVEANCGALATCEPGLAAVGDPCADGDQCLSDVCAESLDGAAVCAKPCSAEDPCPLGTQCLAEPIPSDGTQPLAWCAAGNPPVVVLRGGDDNPHALSGCAAAGGPGGPAGPVLFALGLLGFLGVRRRRRRP